MGKGGNRSRVTKYINRLLIICFLLASCSPQYLVKYSVYSDQGTFKILYSDNIEVNSDYAWEDNCISSDVFIYVKPMETNQILDVRVMYIDDGPLRLYKREVGEGPILIKGKL